MAEVEETIDIKNSQRDEISRKTEAFLKKGGEIKTFDSQRAISKDFYDRFVLAVKSDLIDLDIINIKSYLHCSTSQAKVYIRRAISEGHLKKVAGGYAKVE